MEVGQRLRCGFKASKRKLCMCIVADSWSIKKEKEKTRLFVIFIFTSIFLIVGIQLITMVVQIGLVAGSRIFSHGGGNEISLIVMPYHFFYCIVRKICRLGAAKRTL